jgi:hypothetical protein
MIALVLLAGGTTLLAACSGSSNSASTSTAAGQAAAPGAAQGLASGAASPNYSGGHGPSGSGAGVTARVAPAASIVYTAELTVRVPDVANATDQAAQIAEAAGGYVSTETTSSGSGATTSVQLKIPVDVYPATLSRLTALGTRVSLQRQAQDVTGQVADVNSQVTSDQAAIVQLRALLSHAGSVGDLLTVQNQINSEESALESIESQQRALSAETSYATVTLSIIGPKPKPAPVKHHKATPPPNLTGGLSAGWRALRITVDWTLAFLGAVAPFLAIAALAAFAVYRGRRWMLRRRAA